MCPQCPPAGALGHGDSSWSWHRAHGPTGASHALPGSRQIPWDGGSRMGIPLCSHAPGAAGRLILEQECPHTRWGPGGSLSSFCSRGKGMPGRDGRDGREHPRMGRRCPTAVLRKPFGAQGGHKEVGGATQGEGTACGRKCLAELKLLVEDLEFWAELGRDLCRNFRQRPRVEEGQELSCVLGPRVPSGCHLSRCVPCPSGEGGAEELSGGFLAPCRSVLPPGCCQNWHGDSRKFPGAWGDLDQELKHGITGPGKNRRANKGTGRSVL